MEQNPGPLTPLKVKPLAFWIGLIASIVCAFLLVYRLDWQRLLGLWRRIDGRWVAVGACLILAHTLARAARWRALFTPPVPSFKSALTALLIGQTMNYLLPARSGDLPRIYWLGEQDNQSKARALGTMAVEKLLDLALLVVVLVAVPLWTHTRPSWLARATWVVAATLTVLYVGLRVGLAWHEPLLSRLGRIVHRFHAPWWPAIQARLAQVVEGIEGLRRARVLWRGVAWSLLAWISGAAANWATFLALDLPPSWPMALTVSAALRVGMALPSLPASVGLYEGTVMLALGVFGLDRETALSYGVLMHLIDFAPPVALTVGLVWGGQLRTRLCDER